MTVEKFAEIMGVERNVAYGLLRFLADKGLVQTGKQPQPEGKKGKPAILYFFDMGVGKRLVEHLVKKLNIAEEVVKPTNESVATAISEVE